MDLGAYSQIKSLGELAAKNGIDCPRLRGFRLMADEEPVDISEFYKNNDIAIRELKDLIETGWGAFSWYTLSPDIDRRIRYYIDEKNERIRWDRIHGKHRKMLKTAIHNRAKRYAKQYEVWNKYAGKPRILYIHARIGGGNWSTYCDEVIGQPWFIEKVDDGFDSSYCDIYARIEEV